jgi:hypothetical protein
VRHANEPRECLLAWVIRKSVFRFVRTGFDPERTFEGTFRLVRPSLLCSQQTEDRRMIRGLPLLAIHSWHSKEDTEPTLPLAVAPKSDDCIVDNGSERASTQRQGPRQNKQHQRQRTVSGNACAARSIETVERPRKRKLAQAKYRAIPTVFDASKLLGIFRLLSFHVVGSPLSATTFVSDQVHDVAFWP